MAIADSDKVLIGAAVATVGFVGFLVYVIATHDPHLTRTFSPVRGVTCIETRKGVSCLRDAP